MSKYILEIEGLTKYFSKVISNNVGDNEDERYYILNDLSIRFPKERVTSVLGGNGSGKTTLFNIISGLIDQDSGNINYYYNKKLIDISKSPAYQISRMGIGRLFQENRVFDELSILENMLISDNTLKGDSLLKSLIYPSALNRYHKELIEKANSIFGKLFGQENIFWNKRNDKAGILSYGQKRLLAIARLLIGNYNVLLLDEPTAGLNPAIISEMEDIFNLLKSTGITLIIIEHNIDFVLKVSDFCSFISGGKLSLFGTPNDVLGNEEVADSYLNYLC